MNPDQLNIANLFFRAAASHPDRMAIIDQKAAVTYRELKVAVQKTARYFQTQGIGLGDRVLVFVPMSQHLYRIVLALFQIGATAVFLDEWVSKKRMEICCEIAQCKGFIGVWKARLLAPFSKALRRIPIKLKLTGQAAQPATTVSVPADTAALITFTTGSTGTPKAARRTHEFLKEQFDVLIEEIDPHITDVDMPVLPIVLFVNLGIGCTSVIADFSMRKPEKLEPAAIFRQLHRHGVNRITASPFFIRRLAEYQLAQPTKVSGINKIFTGGAPVFPTEAALYRKAFPDTQVMIAYGSTEAEPISTIEAATLAQRPVQQSAGLTVGVPYHKTALKIIPHTDEILETTGSAVPEGVIGEIIVAGDHVLKQYLNNPSAFRRNKIVEGEQVWHRTGDSGFMRAGELFLTGRCKQLIPISSGWLSPFLIENQLMTTPGITMGTLIQAGNRLVLAVESALPVAQLRERLTSIPHDLIQVFQRIPRDPRHHSKIDYEQLKSQLNLPFTD